MARQLHLLISVMLFLLVMPTLLWAAEENPRVDIERPADWIILSFLAIFITMLFLWRRMSAQQKNRRIMMHYLHNPNMKIHKPDFFKLMSYLASHPKNFKTVQKNYAMWSNFTKEHPDKMHGLYASSLLSACLAIQGLKEEKLSQAEAAELLEQSQKQKHSELKATQNSFLKMVIVQGYMILAVLAPDRISAEPFFQKAETNLIAALNGDLQIFQMIGVLESLAGLYQARAEKSDAPLPYFKQALDYLHMALALNPLSPTIFPALGVLCGNWIKHEKDEQTKNRLRNIAQQSRLAGYELEPFEKDMWLLRLSTVIENNEKIVRGKLGEMLDVQEEKLYDAMRSDPYLQKFRNMPWFQQIMNHAKQYSREQQNS